MDIELATALEENAKLRKDLEELTITNDYQRVISDKSERISFLEGQLDMAKEIINGFLNANTNIDMINAQREAEQFLKENDNE